MKVLIDTGIFVNVLNKEPNYKNSVKFFEKILRKEIDGFISVVTIAEIFSIYFKISDEDTAVAKSYIESFIGKDRIIPVIKQVAELSGKIKASYKISLGDALVIATAILTGCDYLVSIDPEIKKVDLVEVRRPEDV